MHNIARAAANLMFQGFTGQSLEQYENQVAVQRMAQQLAQQCPQRLWQINAIMQQYDATDFWTDGFSCQSGSQSAQVFQSNEVARQLFHEYMELVGMIDGLKGNASTLNHASYQEGYRKGAKALTDLAP